MLGLLSGAVMMAFAGAMLALGIAPARSETPLSWGDIVLKDVEGRVLPASQFEGRVVLLVNTASKCAFTPQYEGLEALWARYGRLGLTVLAVPSNDFGRQEPGSNEQISAFCESRFGITFPILEKAAVTGKQAHPLYAWAREAGGRVAVPAWNFHKVLIGRDGRLIAAFPSFVKPQSRQVLNAVEKALGTPSL